jgi:carboxypeptidase C (cathepsin A)
MRRLLISLAWCCLAGMALAQQPPRGPGARAEATAPMRPALPADAVTGHTLTLPGRTLRFTATAGGITLSDAQGAAQAGLAFVAYQLDGAAPETRPVTFAVNGGPGVASAWLQLGALGPWRLPMEPAAAVPSAPPVLQDNADTWLDFTDLVFIDPVGTGYSGFRAGGEELRRRYFSVRGDIGVLAETIRRWLEHNGRLSSPKFLVGESYGGFRAPRLVRTLADAQGVGVAGMVLISPMLDYGGHSNAFDPLTPAERLPSMVAVARAAKGPVTRETLADVEAYAAGDYLLDLVRGEQDAAAVARRSARVAELTGLDPVLVQRRRGEVGVAEFLSEYRGAERRIASPYDGTITMPDPDPRSPFDVGPDPMRDALVAPLTSAMLDLYARQLHWPPDGQYRLLDFGINRQWDFGNGNSRPEAASALREALAFDPNLRVLVAHGLFDLVTPYFRTKLILDQTEPGAGAERVRLVVYPGGHMFYTRDDSRAALRAAALPLYERH